MARFWQHMASPVIGPIGVTPHSGEVIQELTAAANPNSVETVCHDSSQNAFITRESWHFLEVGPEGQEDGSAEVLLERKTHPRQGGSSSKLGQGIHWEMPPEVDRFPAQVLRPMLDSVKAAVDGLGSGLIVASYSNGLGAKGALPLMLAMAVRATKESWRIAIVGDQEVAGECRLPSAPGWLDYLQGNCGIHEIFHPWKKGEVAWIPQGRAMNCEEPTFFRHSPFTWLRELKKIYSAVLLLCGSADEDSLLSSVARMGDGVFVLGSYHEGKTLYRNQEDWVRRGVPFLGQVVVP